MPHSAVISWIRRSRSTSACEYRRVPFGERLGSISPRASYIRSVCGCISASSAATEIMNTPRSCSTRAVMRVRRVAISAASGRAAGSRSRGLPFITFESCSTAPAAPSLRSSGTRSRSDSAGRRGRSRRARGGPSPRRRWTRAVLGARRDPQLLACRAASEPRPRRRASASATVIGTSTSKLSPLRLNTGDSLDVGDHVQVAGRAAAQAGLALAGEPDPRAVLDAGGDVDAVALDLAQPALAARRSGTGSSITVPLPPQREHGRVIENTPWPWASTPRPLQTGQTFGAVPGRAPVPRQVVHAHVRGHRHRHLRALDRLVERQRDRRSPGRARARWPACARAARRRRVLKMPDRMSENEPKSAAVAPPLPPPNGLPPPKTDRRGRTSCACPGRPGRRRPRRSP